MRRWLLLSLAWVASGCVERAFAQSAPRRDGGPVDARVADAGPRPSFGDLIGDGFGSTGPAGGVGLGDIGRGAGPGHTVGAGGVRLSDGPRAVRDQVTTRGAGLPADAVRRILRRNIAQIAACFDRPTVPAPPAHARVVARFEVWRRPQSNPRVAVASVEGAAPAIHACVRLRLEGTLFPQPETAAPVSVTYTLSL